MFSMPPPQEEGCRQENHAKKNDDKPEDQKLPEQKYQSQTEYDGDQVGDSYPQMAAHNMGCERDSGFQGAVDLVSGWGSHAPSVASGVPNTTCTPGGLHQVAGIGGSHRFYAPAYFKS